MMHVFHVANALGQELYLRSNSDEEMRIWVRTTAPSPPPLLLLYPFTLHPAIAGTDCRGLPQIAAILTAINLGCG